jgi:hypothetical protein
VALNINNRINIHINARLGVILGRYKRQSSVYDRIAQSSGGTSVMLTSAELQAKVEEDLRV